MKHPRIAHLAYIIIALTSCEGDLRDLSSTSSDHAELTIGLVSPLSGAADPTSSPPTLWSTSGGAVLLHGSWDVPLVFAAGVHLPGITAVVRDNTSTCPTCLDGDSVTMVLVSSMTGQISSTTSAGAAGSAVSVGASGVGPTQTLAIPESSRLVADGELFKLTFRTAGLWNTPSTARDMIGSIRTDTPAISRRISSATVQSGNSSASGAAFSSHAWHFLPTGANAPLFFPLPVSTGETINGWSVWVQKGSGPGTSISASLEEIDSATATPTAIGPALSAQAPVLTLTASGLSIRVQAGKSYDLRISNTSGSVFDSFTDAEIQVAQ